VNLNLETNLLEFSQAANPKRNGEGLNDIDRFIRRVRSWKRFLRVLQDQNVQEGVFRRWLEQG
jgi:deoxyribodipyrimidine photolyase-like uncharacterized protein